MPQSFPIQLFYHFPKGHIFTSFMHLTVYVLEHCIKVSVFPLKEDCRTLVQTSFINGLEIRAAGYWHCEIFSFVLASHPQDVQSCGMLLKNWLLEPKSDSINLLMNPVNPREKPQPDC